MPRNPASSRLYRIEHSGFYQASGILDWLITISAVFILSYNIWHVGGYYPYAQMVSYWMTGESVSIGTGPTAPFSARNSLPVTLWYKINGNVVPGFNLSLTLKRNHRHQIFFFPPAIRGAIELQYRILDEEVKVPRELLFQEYEGY